MANNILTIADGDYGYPTSTIATLVQGQYGQSLPLEIRDLAGNVVNLTGFSTLSAIKSSERGRVTSIVGTIALSGTPAVAPQLSWLLDEADTGIAGTFNLVLSISNGTITHETHPVELVILPNPAVNAVAAPGVVGITTAQKTLLSAIQGLTGLVKIAAGSATGVAIQSFMQTFLQSANAVAARLNLLPSYTGNTGKVLAVNGAETDVEWVAQSGGGNVASVFGRTGAVVAASGDYLSSQITDDSNYGSSGPLLDSIDNLAQDIQTVWAAKQDASAKLAAIDALTWAANSIILLTGTATASVQALAAHIVTLLQSADATGARAAIGAGTGNGDLLASNNLSELTATQATARGNIGAGTGNGTYTDNSTIKANDGTVSAPGQAFNSEANTGWYRSGAGVMRLALTGVNQWTFGGTNFSPASSTGPKLMNEAASSINPVFVKSDDLTSGLGWVKTGVPVIVSNSQPTCGFAYLPGIVGSAQTVIANGTGDVTKGLTGLHTTEDGVGGFSAGLITATVPGGTFNLFDDGGTNTLQLQVAANGSVTVIRTAGSRTYSTNLTLNWM